MLEIKIMPIVILEGHIDVSDEDLDLVQSELPNLIELTREESGCLVFRVKQDQESRKRFYVYEEFVSEEAFELHQKRAKESRWGAATKNVKRHYGIRRS